ncbi:MAG: hypothetical protein OXS33_11580 [bacterium]|nr:hypothetical protein [bacterium]
MRQFLKTLAVLIVLILLLVAAVLWTDSGRETWAIFKDILPFI